MTRPGGLEYDEDKVDAILDALTEELVMIQNKKLLGDVEAFASDLEALQPKEFMRKYGVSSSDYARLISILDEAEDIESPIEEGDHDVGLILLYLGLAVTYLARDVERDTEVEAYRASGAEYLNWVTMGDEAVCATCQEYEEGSPYKVEEFPHVPHPWCRCHPEPCDAEGNPLKPGELTAEEVEEIERLMEGFLDVDLDYFEVPGNPIRIL